MSPSRSSFVRVDCVIGHETAKAIKITLVDDRTVWVPLSQVSEIHRNDGWLMVAEWFADKENLT